MHDFKNHTMVVEIHTGSSLYMTLSMLDEAKRQRNKTEIRDQSMALANQLLKEFRVFQKQYEKHLFPHQSKTED